MISDTIRWRLWLIALGGWTTFLCVPADWLPSFIAGGGGPSVHFGWAKVGHVGGYLSLTMSAVLLAETVAARCLLVALLSHHAFATEFVQLFAAKRSGSLNDVGIDHIGILLGLDLGVLWRWLRRRGERIPAPPEPEIGPGGEDADADRLRDG